MRMEYFIILIIINIKKVLTQKTKFYNNISYNRTINESKLDLLNLN